MKTYNEYLNENNSNIEYDLKDFIPITSFKEIKNGDIVYVENERGSPKLFAKVIYSDTNSIIVKYLYDKKDYTGSSEMKWTQKEFVKLYFPSYSDYEVWED